MFKDIENITMLRRLKSPAVDCFVQAYDKENRKVHIAGPFWAESPGGRGIPLTKGE